MPQYVFWWDIPIGHKFFDEPESGRALFCGEGYKCEPVAAIAVRVARCVKFDANRAFVERFQAESVRV